MEHRWEIKRNGTDPHTGQPALITVAEVGDLEYHGEWMGDEYVVVSVRSAEPIDWELNDRLDYRGELFYLCYDPNVVKKARRGTYGEGFTYDNIKLYSVAYGMKSVDFKDVVLEGLDQPLVYTSLSEFSFFAASVDDLADRLQANLQRVSNDWKVYTPDWSRCDERGCDSGDFLEYYGSSSSGYGETDVNVSVTKEQTCWDMLKEVYSQFGLSFYCVGHDIVIGAPAVRTDKVFRYGKGQGLYEIERTSDDGQELVTKVWGYGSTENLPLNYYAEKCQVYKIEGLTKVSYNDGGNTRWVVMFGEGNNVEKYFTNAVQQSSFWPPSHPYHYEAADILIKVGNGNSTIIRTFYYGLAAPDGTGGFDFYNKWYIPCADEQEADSYFGFTLQVLDHVNPTYWPYVEYVNEYPAALSINRLMLPGFPEISLYEWLQGVQNGSISGGAAGGLSAAEASMLLSRYRFSDVEFDPWVRSANSDVAGELEGSVYFDGGQNKAIMPTILNTNAGDVTQGSIITDNGYLQEGGAFEIEVAWDAALNWADALKNSSQDVVISMTSGYCSGRDFKVKKAVEGPYEQNNVWRLTLERAYDNALGRYFPYQESEDYGSAYCQIRVGDKFVVTGIDLPDEFIIAASVKLLLATCGWLDKRDHVRYTYVPRVDEIFMARQDDAVKGGYDAATYGTVSLHDTLKAGMQMQFEDVADLGINRTGANSPYIDQLTIREHGNQDIPTYEVVLRDEKEKGVLEKLTETIAELTSKPTAPVTERSDREQQLQYVPYASWEEGKTYYFEALNTEAEPARLETSRVYRWGGLWECRRTGTQEEPVPGCQDWVEIEPCPVQIVEYDGWHTGTMYYHNAPNREEGYLETSRVWLDWCLWECARTGTDERPGPDAVDWVLIRKEKNYSVDLSAYVDVITVDDVGNVIGGLWTDSGQTREYRIHSVITVRNHDELLLLAGTNEDAGPGTFKIHAEAHDCTYVIEDSTIYITSIAHLKDGVAGSGDDSWDDGDYERMRQMDSCWVDLVIDCEGESSIVKKFPVTIKHSSQPFISMDLSNQGSNVGWNTKDGVYVGLPVTIIARMWHNDEMVGIASTDDISWAWSVPGSEIPPTATVTKSLATVGGVSVAVIRITALADDFPLVANLNITCAVKYAGVMYERTLTHVINKTLDANVYEIRPDYDMVKGHYAYDTQEQRTIVVLNPSTLFVSVQCASTNEGRNYIVPLSNLGNLNLYLKYKVWTENGSGNWTQYTSAGVPITSAVTKVTFQLDEMNGATLVHTHDVEDVPVVINGSNAVSVVLDNDNDTCMATEDGSVIAATLPVAFARLLDGEEVVPKEVAPVGQWTLDCSNCTAVLDGWKGHNDYSWITSGEYWMRLHVTSVTDDAAYVRVCCQYTKDGETEVYAHTLNIKKLYGLDKYDIVATPKHICYTPSTDSYSADAITVDVYQTTQAVDRHLMPVQGFPNTLRLSYSVNAGAASPTWTALTYGQTIPKTAWNIDGVDNVHIRLEELITGESGRQWVERATEVVDIVADGGEGTPGEPAFTGELNPVAGFFYVNADGIVEMAQTISTNVKLWLGEDSPQTITSLTCSVTTKAGGSVSDSMVSKSADAATGVVSFYIHILNPSAVTPGLIAYITAVCSAGTKVLRFMIEPIKRGVPGTPGAPGADGSDGEDAVTYEIRTTAPTALIPANVSRTNYTGTFSFWKTVGAGAASAYTCHWIFYYRKGTSYHVIPNQRSGSDDYKRSSYTLTASTSRSWQEGGQTLYEPQDAIVAFIGSSIFNHTDWQTTAPTTYQAMLEVPIMKNGDLGRMYYPAGEWNANNTYTRTADLCPFVEYNGDYYYLIADTPLDDLPPEDSGYWALCSQFGVVFTEALFADFGKLGSSIFSGDYQISQYGWMLGYNNTRTPIYSPDFYTTIDPNDVFGRIFPTYFPYNAQSVNVGNTIQPIGIYCWTGSTRVTSISLTGGKYYSLKVLGTNILWRVALASDSESKVRMTDYISGGTSVRVDNFYVEESGTYSVWAQTYSTGTGGASCELAECKFVPNLVTNYRTGESQMEHIYLKAGISRSMLEVTPSNYALYVKSNSISNYNYVDIFTLCTNIRFTAEWSSSDVTIPTIYLPLITGMSASELDIVRGLSKQDIVIVNNSSKPVPLTGGIVKYYSEASAVGTIPAGKTAIITCDYGFEETVSGTTVTYGDEYVKWRVRIKGDTDTR